MFSINPMVGQKANCLGPRKLLVYCGSALLAQTLTACDPEPTLFVTSLLRPHLSGVDKKFIIGASTYRGFVVPAEQ